MVEPHLSEQLQGKRNARAWKRQFKIAALGKGVWDVFTGVFFETASPDPDDYGLHGSGPNITTSASDDGKAPEALANLQRSKSRRNGRSTLGPEDVLGIIQESAEQGRKGLDFSGRMALYKFNLDEYDKSRKIVATAMALLLTWVHPSLRSQLEDFTDPRLAYEHLVARYSVTDARAREMSENKFSLISIGQYRTAQDYVNAIENAARDITEAGGYCDDAMIISKIIRGLGNHYTYKHFATQYHLLRDIDSKFEELDHVITQLLTFESSQAQDLDSRPDNRRSGFHYSRTDRYQRNNDYFQRRSGQPNYASPQTSQL